MAQLLVVHHTVSPVTAEILDAVRVGLDEPELAHVRTTYRAALTAGPVDVFHADAVLLVTPVNIGYLSGAMKHFFDGIYYPCQQEKNGLPFGAVLHCGSDASGALRALAAITGGMGWSAVAAPLVLSGPADEAARGRVRELSATLGAYAAGFN